MRPTAVILACMAALPPMWLPASAEAGYQAKFNSGNIPKEITVSNANGLTPVLSCYSAGYTTEGWTVDRVGMKGYCAVTPTHTRSGKACENVMTLPEIDIEEGMWLRWEALSVAPDLPESYCVRAAVDGGSPVTLFEVDGENDEWVTRMVPLSGFAGHSLRVEFVCNSVDRYLLAIAGLKIETPSTTAFEAVDRTVRFGGTLEPSLPSVRVTATNIGAAANVSAVECVDRTDGMVYGTYTPDSEWGTAETLSFEFPIEEYRGGDISYSVNAVLDNNERVTLSEGDIFVSSYPRTLLVDKGTATWCVNCPQAMLDLEAYKRMFGASIIAVETHCNADIDPLTDSGYWDGLGFYAAPTFMVNRIRKSSSQTIAGITGYFDMPTTFKVTLGDVKISGKDSAEITATAVSASDVDNSSGRYRVGYVLTADFHDPENIQFRQQNSINGPYGYRFYFMPSVITPDLMTHHDVSLTSDNAFTGFEGSLPTTLESGKEYTHTWTIDRPELLDDIRRGRVVAYIVDAEEGDVENAAALMLDGNSGSGIYSAVKPDASPEIRYLQGGTLMITLPESGEYRLDTFDMSGMLRFTATGTADSAAVIETGLPKGIYVTRLTTRDDASMTKIIVR